MSRLKAYLAERYVIAVRTTSGSRKLFQIVPSKGDGSLYITFPYYRHGGGQMGEVQVDANKTFPSNLIVGDAFSVSTHYVKYSHHPSGLAQFSLSGKVRSSVRKASVPLSDASGHLFTFMVQGLDKFDVKEPTEKGKPKRGLVEFGLDCDESQSLKFVGRYYSEREFAARATFNSDMPWLMGVTPDGRRVMALALATTYFHKGERRYLILSAEKVPQITKSQEVFMSFMGGFDPPDVALNHSVPTTFLMFIYPIDAENSTLTSIDL
jgi:hypothetical protein